MKRLTSEQIGARNRVALLVDYLRMEIGSDALPSTSADRLLRDIDKIPVRFEQLCHADNRERQRRKTRAKR